MTEIVVQNMVMLDSRSYSGEEGSSQNYQNAGAGAGSKDSHLSTDNGFEDDIPF